MGKKEETLKRVVIDTNVLVSAFLFKGSLAKIVGDIARLKQLKCSAPKQEG